MKLLINKKLDVRFSVSSVELVDGRPTFVELKHADDTTYFKQIHGGLSTAPPKEGWNNTNLATMQLRLKLMEKININAPVGEEVVLEDSEYNELLNSDEAVIFKTTSQALYDYKMYLKNLPEFKLSKTNQTTKKSK